MDLFKYSFQINLLLSLILLDFFFQFWERYHFQLLAHLILSLFFIIIVIKFIIAIIKFIIVIIIIKKRRFILIIFYLINQFKFIIKPKFCSIIE